MPISTFAQDIRPNTLPDLRDRSTRNGLWKGFFIREIQTEDGIGKPTAWVPFERLAVPGHTPCIAGTQDLAIYTLPEDAQDIPTVERIVHEAEAEGYVLATLQAVLAACAVPGTHERTAELVGRRPLAILGDAIRRTDPQDPTYIWWRYATLVPYSEGRLLCLKDLRGADLDRNGILGPFASGRDTGIFLARPSRLQKPRHLGGVLLISEIMGPHPEPAKP
jgi:hypothetical protein